MSFADIAVPGTPGTVAPGTIDPGLLGATLPQDVQQPNVGQPGPQHTSLNPVSFSEGLIGNFVGGLAGTLKGIFGIGEAALHDVGTGALKAVTAGHYHSGFLLDDLVKAMPHAIAHDYAQRYGPLFHAHFGQFFEEMYQHPFSFLMDAATAATAGSAGGAEVAGKAAELGGDVTAGGVASGLLVATKNLVKGVAPIPGLKGGISEAAAKALVDYGSDAAKVGGTVESASKLIGWAKGHAEVRIDPATGIPQTFYKLDPFQRWMHDRFVAPLVSRPIDETLDTMNPLLREADVSGKPFIDMVATQQLVRDKIEQLLANPPTAARNAPLRFSIWKDTGTLEGFGHAIRLPFGGLSSYGKDFADRLMGYGWSRAAKDQQGFQNGIKAFAEDMPDALKTISPEQMVDDGLFNLHATLDDGGYKPANGSIRREEVFAKTLGEASQGDLKNFWPEGDPGKPVPEVRDFVKRATKNSSGYRLDGNKEFGDGHYLVRIKDEQAATAAAAHASVMDKDLVDSAGRPMGVRASGSDIEGHRIVFDGGVTPDGVQRARDFFAKKGDTITGEQNMIDAPGNQGERAYVLHGVHANGDPFEVQLMDPWMSHKWDVYKDYRYALRDLETGVVTGKFQGEAAAAKAQSDIAALTARMKGGWAFATEKLREQRVPGFQASKILEHFDSLRDLTAKYIEGPAIKNGWLNPTQALNDMYLPMRIMYGAEYNAEHDAWTGGMSALELDAQRAAEGLTQPIYYPNMDAERLGTPTHFFARKQPSVVGAIRRDVNLRQNQAKLLTNYVTQRLGEGHGEGPKLSTDLTRVYSVRARRAINMQTDVNIANMIAAQGRVLDPAKPDLAQGEMRFHLSQFAREMSLKHLAEDTYLSKVGTGATEAEASDAMAKAIAFHLKQSLPFDGDPTRDILVALPEAIGKRLNQHLRTMGARSGLAAGVDKATRFWKDSVLGWSPRWAVHHLLSNGLFLKMQEGRLLDAVRLAFPESELSKAYNAAFGELDLGNNIYSPDYAKAGAAAQKAVDEKWGSRVERNAMKDIGTLPRTNRLVVHALLDAYRKASIVRSAETVAEEAGLSEGVHSFYAMKGTYETMARVGYDPELAAKALDQTVKYQGDFTKMTPLAKNVIRPYVAPFYPFYRHIAQLTLRFPFEHPARANLMRNLGISYNDMSVHGGPSWLEGAVPIGPGANPGDTRYLSGNNPFNTFFGGVGGFFQSLSPVWQMGYAQATGRSVLSGKPYTAPDVVTPFGSEQQFKRMVGPDGKVEFLPIAKTTPSLPELMMQQIPQYQLVKDLVAGGQTYTTSSLFDALTKKGVIQGADPANPGGFGVKYPTNTIQALARLLGYSTYDFDMTKFLEQRTKDAAAAVKAYEKRVGESTTVPTGDITNF